MKSKFSPVVCSILAFAFAAEKLPAQAEGDAIALTETQLFNYEKHKRTADWGYALKLSTLSFLYWNVGRKEESEATLRKALVVTRAMPEGKNLMPSILINWSESVADHALGSYQNLDFQQVKVDPKKVARKRAEDLSIARRKMKEAQVELNKLPETSEARLNLTIRVIQFYMNIGDLPEVNRLLDELDRTFFRWANAPKAKKETIETCAEGLDKLSVIFCPSPVEVDMTIYGLRKEHAAQISRQSQANFKVAEYYKLRSMAQWDRLPESHPSRIAAQRALVLWYRKFDRSEPKSLQTEKLKKLLKIDEPEKLLPEERSGCGNSTSGVFCGMG